MIINVCLFRFEKENIERNIEKIQRKSFFLKSSLSVFLFRFLIVLKRQRNGLENLIKKKKNQRVPVSA